MPDRVRLMRKINAMAGKKVLSIPAESTIQPRNLREPTVDDLNVNPLKLYTTDGKLNG